MIERPHRMAWRFTAEKRQICSYQRHGFAIIVVAPTAFWLLVVKIAAGILGFQLPASTLLVLGIVLLVVLIPIWAMLTIGRS